MSDTPWTDTREALFQTTNSRVSALQNLVLKDDSVAVATLARLRRCNPAEVGAEPLVWEITLGNLPDTLTCLSGRRTDQPTPAEQALHAALVLYALHQRSKDERVHQPGVRFGQAVGTLARARADQDEEFDRATVSRLHQVALAETFDGRLHYLRGLIQLMRVENPSIGLDYARLATDLWQLASPQLDSQRVLLSWGRDLHQRPKLTDPMTITKETK